MWRKEGQLKPSRPEDHQDCVNDAHELYDFYNARGSFPRFWCRIQFDKQKLASIFVFFCETRMIESTLDTRQIGYHLEETLKARWRGNTVSTPPELTGKIKDVSHALIAAFDKLEEEELIDPAFELFSSGSMAISRNQIMTKGISKATKPDDKVEPEPDSGSFFYWAEFALLAAGCKFDVDSWVRILPVLLRSEEIFALCYGQPVDGEIPPDRKFEHYYPVVHTPLDPCETRRILPTSSNCLEDLIAEQEKLTQFAFPGGFD